MPGIKVLFDKQSDIRGWPLPASDEKSEAKDFIEKMTYGNIWKDGTIKGGTYVRLDSQAKETGKDAANLQIQLQEKHRKPKKGTTIAGATVAGNLRDFGAMTQLDDQGKILRAVKAALHYSLNRGKNTFVHKQS